MEDSYVQVQRLVHATEDDWAYLSMLAGLCRDVVDEWKAHSRRTQWRSQPDSPLRQDVAETLRQNSPIDYVWSEDDIRPAPGSAFSYLSVAAVHIQAVSVLLETGAVMYSLGPLVRSIFEHCGRVAWALDPTIFTRERLARCFWIRYDDLQQARRMAKAFDSQKELQDFVLKSREMKQQARAMFFESECEEKKGDLVALCGQKLPGFSELVSYLAKIYPDENSWQPGPIYDALSARTHPTMHITRSLMREHLEQSAVSDEPASVVRLKMETLDEPRELSYIALFCFIDMWRLIAMYFGLDPDEPVIVALLHRLQATRNDMPLR